MNLMALDAGDVQSILEAAIVQAKLAPVDVAPGLATTLAAAITPNLNALTAPMTGKITTVAVAPVMSVDEALTVRDAVASVVSEADDSVAANPVAEALLMVGYVDVPSILSSVRAESSRPATGSTRAVTGSVATGSGQVVS